MAVGLAVSKHRMPEDVSSDVLALIRCARGAVQERNIAAIVKALGGAVAVYEQHPSQVHAPASLFSDLLVFIRSARTLCKTLKQSDDDLRKLQERAEALGRPLH